MSDVARTFRDLASVAPPDRPCHVAIGMFDGVHRGHQAVIEAAVQGAHQTGGAAGVFTFWPHPSRLFRPDDPTRMIFGPNERNDMLLRLGADFVIEQPFTAEFAAIEAEEFVVRLKRALPRLETIYVGKNWRFGRGRKGDVALLVQLARAEHVNVVSAAPLSYNGERISSTRVRTLLEKGDVEGAAELLGYPYFASGAVVEGRRLGRTIGFPTLNIDWRPDLRPAYGVYAVSIRGDEGRPRRGVANYGVRPTTTGAGEAWLEVHVLDENLFGPGDRVRVDWLRRLREERRFGSLDELRAQIARDRDAALAFFHDAPGALM